uniref:Uncharacterized protein n=1 Tax=Arundo donax TaxID=35708 RepID=A0A0A8YDR9_ARUDO
MAPRPPVGIHRYVTVLYQQKARVAAPAPVPGVEGVRGRFRNRAFAARHHLGLPVAAVYFNAQKETANRRRRY